MIRINSVRIFINEISTCQEMSSFDPRNTFKLYVRELSTIHPKKDPKKGEFKLTFVEFYLVCNDFLRAIRSCLYHSSLVNFLISLISAFLDSTSLSSSSIFSLVNE